MSPPQSKSSRFCIKSVVRTVVLRAMDGKALLKQHSLNQPLWFTVIHGSLENASDPWGTDMQTDNLILTLTMQLGARPRI